MVTTSRIFFFMRSPSIFNKDRLVRFLSTRASYRHPMEYRRRLSAGRTKRLTGLDDYHHRLLSLLR